MNDKVRELLENAEQSDAIARNKWRIENREQLRKERKEKLKELMEKDKTMTNNKQTSVEQLFHKLWDTPKDKFTWYAILEEHIAMHKKECVDLLNKHNDIFDTSEDHYNQTFGSDETIQ